MRTTGLLCCTALAVALTLELGVYADKVSAQTTTEQPVVTSSAVPLKTGDRVRITVVGFQELSGEQMVLSDGTVALPLAGNVRVGGLTPSQANARLREVLQPYIRRPQVGLTVVSVSPLRISVSGEVLRPGPRLLTPPSPMNSTTDSSNYPNNLRDTTALKLSDALVQAGGVTPNADIRNVTIRRLALDSSSDKAKLVRTETKIDLWQAIQAGDLGADLPILDGDEIVVPKAQLTRGDQQQLLTSTVAPTKVAVQVGGQVQRPGRVEIEPSAEVNDAIGAAGGLTDKADYGEIELIRMTSEGRLEKKKLAFGTSSGPLRNGDLIVVKKSSGSKLTDFLGSVFSPLISPLIFLLK